MYGIVLVGLLYNNKLMNKRLYFDQDSFSANLVTDCLSFKYWQIKEIICL